MKRAEKKALAEANKRLEAEVARQRARSCCYMVRVSVLPPEHIQTAGLTGERFVPVDVLRNAKGGANILLAGEVRKLADELEAEIQKILPREFP